MMVQVVAVACCRTVSTSAPDVAAFGFPARLHPTRPACANRPPVLQEKLLQLPGQQIIATRFLMEMTTPGLPVNRRERAGGADEQTAIRAKYAAELASVSRNIGTKGSTIRAWIALTLASGVREVIHRADLPGDRHSPRARSSPRQADHLRGEVDAK